jgi:hypothetical protein
VEQNIHIQEISPVWLYENIYLKVKNGSSKYLSKLFWFGGFP